MDNLFNLGWILEGRGRLFLCVSLLSLGAYWPALNNGFISDDYVFLERVETWAGNPLYLFEIPPENFRATTYAAFLALKRLAGYRSEFFYLFTILLHAANCLLVAQLFSHLTRDRWVGVVAAILFATFQNPNEAVMWLGGMHESLLCLFLLSSLVCWLRGYRGWSVFFFCLALLSKESALILLILLPLVDGWRENRVSLRREYVHYLLLPTLVFLALIWFTHDSNSLLAGRFYAFGPHGITVLVKSVHHLAFPWVYLLGIAALLNRSRPPGGNIGWTAAWVIVALLPYVFLTYQDHVPSRHEQLASVGVVGLLAIILRSFRRDAAVFAFLLVFSVVNAGYIALRKDAQFEERAAPTQQLLSELSRREPSPLGIADFPYSPWVAKLTSRLRPGWNPQLIYAENLSETCPNCTVLRWDRSSRSYQQEPALPR